MGFLISEVGHNWGFCTLLLILCNKQVQTFVFHSNVQKVVEELKYSSKSSHFHCPIGYSFGMVSVGTIIFFVTLDFSFLYLILPYENGATNEHFFSHTIN